MCLDKLQKIRLPKDNIGYQALEYKDGVYSRWSEPSKKLYKPDKFYDSKSKGKMAYTQMLETYEPAFHICRYKKDAEGFAQDKDVFRGGTIVVRKVEFKEVIHTGIQWGAKIIVARIRKILEK